MTVDKSNVTISETTDSTGTQKITVAVMDQYSAAYNNYAPSQPELKSSNNPSGLTVSAAKSAKNKTTITISASGATVGTYAYTMDLTDSEKSTNVKKVSFSVTVSKQLQNVTYALVMMNDTQDTVISKVDTTVTKDEFQAITLKPTIVAKNNGSITSNASASVVSIGALKLTKNGATVSNTKGIYTGTGDNAGIATAEVYVRTGDGSAAPCVKNLEPGTYTLSLVAKINNGTNIKDYNMSTSFVVEDSQKVFEASVKKENVTNNSYSTLKQIFEDTEYVTFSYAGHDLHTPVSYPYTYADADYTKVNAKSIRVKKVSMDVTVPGTDRIVRLTADVNRTFTFGSAITSAKDSVSEDIEAVIKKYTSATPLSTASQAALVAEYADITTAFNGLTAGEQSSLKPSYDKLTALCEAEAGAYITAKEQTEADAKADLAIVENAVKAVSGAAVSKEVKQTYTIVSGSTITVTPSVISVTGKHASAAITGDNVTLINTAGSIGFKVDPDTNTKTLENGDEIKITYEIAATNTDGGTGVSYTTDVTTITVVYTYVIANTSWTAVIQ